MRNFKLREFLTPRGNSTLDKYLIEINKTKLISIEKEIELAQRIKKGDGKALKELVEANLRFVVSVAKQYQNQGLTLPDLINEGNIGLIKAAEKFDDTKGFRFISYAVWWIRQAIMESIQDNGRNIKISENTLRIINKINEIKQNFKKINERDITNEELSEKLNISLNDVKKYISYMIKEVSSNQKFDDTELCIEDNLESTDIFFKSSRITDDESFKKTLEVIFKSKNRINSENKQIIIEHLGLFDTNPKDFYNLSKDYGLTRERVRQKYKKGLEQIRNNYSNILKEYL